MFLILILVFTFLVLFLLLRKKSLVLLKDKGYLKINILNRFTNKLFSKLPFYRRFKLSIAFRSVIKLIMVSLIFFLTSLLIIFGMGISSLFKKTIDSIYKDMTFKYLVIFNYNVEQNDLYKNTDYLLSLEESIKKIGNKKINEKVYIVGIDEKQNYFKVTDEKLTENDIVINDNLKKRYGLKIGDIVNISITNKIYSFKVKGFTKGSDDYYVYVDRYFLSKVLGYKNKVYNEIYSIDKKYQSMNNLSKEEVTKINTILNLNDLKQGLQKQMASYVSIIYFLAFLSLIVALVIVYSAGAGLGYQVAKGFFDTIPRSLDEAAKIDGATRSQIFWQIILPLSKPIIVYTALTTFIGPWTDYIFVSYFMKDNSDNYTVALGLYSMLGNQTMSEYFTVFCAGAVVIAIPITILFVVMQRFYVEGVTGGAVKG